ncbi:aryl-sulfate sulfotransferase [Haloarcula salinisoli]|uniref:Aryl-sulfate sulfotransferase n=1 Tax=Haloarcula salinisoli TaxID=2487746 RepID=A0A8J8C6G4_9EURY|nr:aryl-sulfate sulfotransferase [Halomicroarcula salinisoli]MBX0302217.1 aryl-sulfate sulfotransferase [Halomicroarcula salinisoli]
MNLGTVLAGQRLRVAFALATLLFGAVLVGGYATAESDATLARSESATGVESGAGTSDPVVPPRDNITVVGTDSTAFITDDGDGPRKRAELVAFASNGSVYYRNESHTRYWDVDPVDGTNATVEYVYADHLSPADCNSDSVCTRNGIERVNLTTGNVTHIYSRITPGKHSTRWHDADRIGEDRLLVADIAQDRAFVVNTTTEQITWSWDAQTDFETNSGGPYPEDWTHINDVEYVELDGRETVMVSVRNHDQVVFVDMETGLRENWTLGSDGDHDTLYEQHNPDFIPAERGGPAVLVADSENGRVVEYQRANGSWKQSWEWRDQRLTWPRDADRLPSGHTLITDSNGDRVLEIDRNGSVVWSSTIGFPYESERLGTGDESAGGRSAAALGLPDRTPTAENRSVVGDATTLLPKSVVNSVAYLLPGWVGPVEALAAVGLLGVLVLWAVVEWRRRSFEVHLRWPVQIRNR